MKKHPMIFIIIICIFLSASYSQQKVEWKGTIKEEDGVKVIKNPHIPLFGEIEFELEEDLSIGKEDDNNYMFFRVRGIAVDKEENIYVTDIGNYRIQKFDKNGNFLQSIGRKGQGPGEFQWVMRLKIDDLSGDLHIRDGPRVIKIFNKQGKYKNQIQLEKPIDGFYFDGKGHYLAIQQTVSDAELSKTLCKINTEGEIIKIYAKFPWEIFYQRKGEVTTMGSFPYVHDLIMSKINAETFIYANSGEYELNVTDEEGRILYKIQKEATPQGFSAREKQRFNNIKIPPHKPYFYSMLTDNNGRIYVQRNKTKGEDFKVDREVDIFSKDGYFIYRSIIPQGTYLIKDGFLYEYFMNEDTGEELVKRQKIKNWDQIKKEI